MNIKIWILSTTHIDRQNQRMAKSALDDMENQINTKYLPQLIEHDWDKRVGIVLYAEVFQLNDWEYALWWVIGIFENEAEREEYKIWAINNISLEYKHYLNIETLINMVDRNKPDTLKKEDIDFNVWNELEKYLNSTNIAPDWRVYHIKKFIAWFWWIKIELYPKDHDNPKHFHVISKQHNLNARFDLNTFEYISTKHWKITNKLKKQVKQFFLDNIMYIEKLKMEYKRMR